jgi:3-deoxy-D-manno-octulosonate 8-phosphate phosphatase (KDO 8-P phosphatase)
LLNKFKQITTFIFDVDGVLTDGSLLVMPGGLMARRMNIKDGYALQLAIKKGYRVLVISGGNSPEVAERLAKLGVTSVWMQVTDKAAQVKEFMTRESIGREELLYMGDDIPDLKVMQICGLPCCPVDAVQEIKDISVYISHFGGGAGCARDVIEKTMKLRGDWSEDTSVRAQ